MLTFSQFITEAAPKPHGFKPLPKPKMGGPKKTSAKGKAGGFLGALAPKPPTMPNPLMPSKSVKNKNPFLAKPKKVMKPKLIQTGKLPGASGIKRPKPLATMLGGMVRKGVKKLFTP